MDSYDRGGEQRILPGLLGTWVTGEMVVASVRAGNSTS